MTIERINECFQKLRAQNKPALVAYLTIGDPSVDDSIACAAAALATGADMLEIGVPFSDPTADGPVISQAAYRAIQNGGSLSSSLRVAQTLRKKSAAPFVLFTYYNPIVAYGEARLVADALAHGVDGLLVVDLPPEEGRELRERAKASGLAIIPLIAPTTGRDREPLILSRASGFIYYVSVTGVTGAAEVPIADSARAAAELGVRAQLPVVLGFGIRTAENARAAAEHGVDGVVVGTEIVRAITRGNDRESRVRGVETLIRALRHGLDSAERK